MHSTSSAIRHRGSRDWRAAVGPGFATGQITRYSEVIDVVPRPTRRGPVLAVPRGRAIDHVGLDFANRLKPDSQSVHDAGPIAFYHHVRPSGQFQKGGLAGFSFQIDSKALEASPRAVTVEWRPNLFGALFERGRNLDHSGAIIGQGARRARRRPHTRQIQDGNSLELRDRGGHTKGLSKLWGSRSDGLRPIQPGLRRFVLGARKPQIRTPGPISV